MSECRCSRPTRDGYVVCDTCTQSLEVALGNVTWLNDELDTTITRQRSAAIEGGPRSAEHGLPWHERASKARRNLHGLLVSWVRFCREEGVRGAPGWTPADSLPSLSRWLLHCRDGLALHDIGPDAVDEITDAVSECERIVFWKRRNRVYLGPCGEQLVDDDGTTLGPCPDDVYAEEGEPVGACNGCGEKVTVVIRQGELNERLDGRLCTPAEIATFSVFLGLHAPRESVRKKVSHWADRRVIERRGDAPNGDPLYRYGEVRPLLYAHFVEKVKS